MEESPELQILEEKTDNSFEKICALIDENEKLTEKNLQLEHDIQKLKEVNMEQVRKFEDQVESLLQDNETLEEHIKSLNRRLLKEEIEKEGLTEINEEKRELISEYKIMNLKNLGSINVSKKQDNQSEDTRNIGRENETVNTWTLVEKEKSLKELSDECNQIVFNVMKDINLQFNPPHKLRKRRSVINAATRFALEEVFKQNPRPSAEKLAVLCESLDMEREVVRVWFQNRRRVGRRHGLEKTKEPEGEPEVAPPHLKYRKGEELFPPDHRFHHGRQSRVWQYGGFKKDEDGKLDKSRTFCGLCGKDFRYFRSPDRLLRHLRNTHPNEFNEKSQEENNQPEETDDIEMDTTASQGQGDEQSEEIGTVIEMETVTSHEQENDVGEETDHTEVPEMIEYEHTEAEKFLEESSSDEDELSTDEKSDGKQKIATVLNSRRTYCKNCPVCIQEDCNTCANCLDRPKNGGANKLKQKCMIKAKCVYANTNRLKCPLPDCSVEKTYPKLWLLQWHIGSHFSDIFLKHFPKQNNCPLCPRKIHSVTEHVYHLGVSHKTLLDVIPEDDLRKEYILPFFKKYI